MNTIAAAHMTNTTPVSSITFASLPQIGGQLDGGKFFGITTQKDGTHAAVILLPNKAQEISWNKAMTWAKKQGGELPSRPVAAMLFANLKSNLDPKWHWTSDEEDASFAWYCIFNYGYQHSSHKSYEGSAFAVRLIPLIA